MAWNGKLLTFEIIDDIALIGIDRNNKRNAISGDVLEEILLAVELAEKNAGAAVIYGHGDHFCAGLDLGEFSTKSPFEALQVSRRWHEIFSRIEYSAIPWVAALHGAVVGGGLELASAVHIRVAEPSAFFAFPEGQRGIFVGGGASVRSARLMGASRMADMMLTGRVISSEQAERWGIVQYITEDGQAKLKAIELASATLRNAKLSNFAIIQALPRIQDMSKEDGLFVEAMVSSFTSTSTEAQERLQEFLSKRAKPIGRPELAE